MFDTVLVANRGEIALRVVRTCRDMGIATVVVHSGVDRDSAAARAADHRVNIGPADPHRSYLYAPAIVEAARQTGAQAIHPGYGFLSEDPDFARICAENGLVFVGPDAEVTERLGDKSTARRIMADAGLPVVPGSREPVSTADEAAETAHRIGFPLIVKAVAGGGGRGMAVVHEAGALLPTFRATRAAAQAAFGDNRVYLEQYLHGARHIEIQILADGHGNVVHLGERDCSVQRRHQKLVEESPAPRLPAGLADRLAAHAVAGAKAVGYRGAGTFEFLVRGEDAAFIEVNSRIQVEHPVTEMVTGIDIVREQLLVAAGERLSFGQDAVRHRGVAVECRINAEDPARDFAPCPGTLTDFTAPAGPFVRVDTHAFPGAQARPEYDSLLAKVVTWGPDRDQALARMRRALRELRVEGPGIRTTAPLLAEILAEPDFVAGRHDTTLLDRRGR